MKRYVIESDLSKEEIRDLLKGAGAKDAEILEERKDCGVSVCTCDDLSSDEKDKLRCAGIDPAKVLCSAAHNGGAMDELLEAAVDEALVETKCGDDRWLVGTPWDHLM